MALLCVILLSCAEWFRESDNFFNDKNYLTTKTKMMKQHVATWGAKVAALVMLVMMRSIDLFLAQQHIINVPQKIVVLIR